MSTAVRSFARQSGMFNQVRLRTLEEKNALQKICDACPSFKAGWCTAQKCCGGKIETAKYLTLNINDCPLGKFPK